jgi:hypothetical protein
LRQEFHRVASLESTEAGLYAALRHRACATLFPDEIGPDPMETGYAGRNSETEPGSPFSSAGKRALGHRRLYFV